MFGVMGTSDYLIAEGRCCSYTPHWAGSILSGVRIDVLLGFRDWIETARTALTLEKLHVYT